MADNGEPLPVLHKYQTIRYWSNEDRALIAEATELAGCVAHGDDQETVLWNIKDAVQF